MYNTWTQVCQVASVLTLQYRATLDQGDRGSGPPLANQQGPPFQSNYKLNMALQYESVLGKSPGAETRPLGREKPPMDKTQHGHFQLFLPNREGIKLVQGEPRKKLPALRGIV